MRKILVTRPRLQAESFEQAIRANGDAPILFPVIEISPPEDYQQLDSALQQLSAYDWLVFTSVNGVHAVWQRLTALGVEGLPPGLQVAAIGPKTAQALEQNGRVPDFVPGEYVAEAILPGLGDLVGRRVLLPRADLARPDLAQAIILAGGFADEVVAYRTLPARPDSQGLQALRQGVDLVTFTSSSTVRNFVSLVKSAGLDPHRLPGNPHFACIGPITAATARAEGFPVAVVAQEYTGEGLLQAINHQSPVRFQPTFRPRRLRLTSALRGMLRETELNPRDFIYPLFVRHGNGEPRPIHSMPGVYQWTLDRLAAEVREVADLGIPAVILFGIPATKDPIGLENFSSNGVVQRAIRTIKDSVPEMLVVTDVCLCEYTDHGHCGILNTGDPLPDPRLPEGYLLNDDTLEILGRVAVSHADAGADIVAPSGMIDGMVTAIRTALDSAGFPHIAILSYSVKYASAFYGPFREAAESPPRFGDRQSHQMDPANAREALREAELDVREGADMLMVKPAMPYLDVIQRIRQAHPQIPLGAYHVSGEYSMLKAAAANGWLDERRAVLEALTAIQRAGADFILTYHAKDAARWLRA